LECLALSASDQRPAPRRSTVADQVHAAVAVKVHAHDQVNVNDGCLVEGSPGEL
jgi:hypothetical protein